MELQHNTVHNDAVVDAQPYADDAPGQNVRPWGTVAMSQTDLRGQFVWHELMSPNAQAAAAFYSNVLPWTSESSTVPGYILWMKQLYMLNSVTQMRKLIRFFIFPQALKSI